MNYFLYWITYLIGNFSENYIYHDLLPYFKIGNGGNAGRQTIYVTKIRGKIQLKTCRGNGGQAAINRKGGDG